VRASVLLSGGKDSVYAAYLAQQYGWDVGEAIVIVPPSADSFMFHHPNAALAVEIAAAMGMEATAVESSGDPEGELAYLRDAISSSKATGIVTGAIASDYQWSRMNRVCADVGKRCFSPLWRKDQARVLREEVDSGFDIRIVAVQAEGLGREWLGAKLDAATASKLADVARGHRLNVAGEGGEYETIVLDGPNFKHCLAIDNSSESWSGISGRLDITALRRVACNESC
jgi:ABC transporter with metal-binding/Fe-S-binding domain ATP-binding protein